MTTKLLSAADAPESAINIGWGTEWQSPWQDLPDLPEMYRKYVRYRVDHIRAKLRGKTLVCRGCKAGKRCHGHVLVEIAEGRDVDSYDDLLG